MAKKKKFNVKVFDKSGNFISNFSPDELVNDPSFPSEMNGGLGELRLTIRRPFDDFNEGSDINFENIIKVFEFDSDNMNGRLIYTGVCKQYIPSAERGSQFIDMSAIGQIEYFSRAYFNDGDLTVNYTGGNVADPADMIRDIIDNLLVDYPNSGISYSGGHIDNLGSTVSHEFVERKWSQAVSDAFGFMGAGWYWRLAEDGQFWLKQKPSVATHTFEFNKHIDDANVDKNTESMANRIILKYNGGQVTVEDAASISAYGKHERIFTDTKISGSGTATNKANQLLNDNKAPKISAKIQVNSSYDIESIKPGETCKILGLKKDNTLFTDNMQIVRIDYRVDFAVLYLEDIKGVFGTQIDKFTTFKNEEV